MTELISVPDEQSLEIHKRDSNGLAQITERLEIPALEGLTATEKFFVLHHYAAPPRVEADHWCASISGLVATPTEVDLRSLEQLPSTTSEALIECAGNSRRLLPYPTPGAQLGNGAVSNARWTGVPLRSVLELAGGVDRAAVQIVVWGRDAESGTTFGKGLPLEKALDDDTLLAWEMNDGPIPFIHGGPVRLVVPGWYGVWWVKWIAGIEAIATDFDGYWQTERYTYRVAGKAPEIVASQRVKSVVLAPSPNDVVAEKVIRLEGLAWSGDAPVDRVEVRLPDGQWHDATLHPVVDTRWTWVPWSYDWASPGPGMHTVSSRASDSAGNTQPAATVLNEFAYGNNAIQEHVFSTAPATPE